MAQSHHRESKPIPVMVWTASTSRWVALGAQPLDPAMVKDGNTLLKEISEKQNFTGQTCQEIRVFWGRRKDGTTGILFDLTMRKRAPRTSPRLEAFEALLSQDLEDQTPYPEAEGYNPLDRYMEIDRSGKIQHAK